MTQQVHNDLIIKIQSITAKEIIMAMIAGLENPVTKIDMGTFGRTSGEVCYGCAATNALCKLVDYSTEDFQKIGERFSHDELENSYAVFCFEYAIDSLRCGRVDEYNMYAEKGGFAKIKKLNYNLHLPYLTNDYTPADLEPYKQLAEAQ